MSKHNYSQYSNKKHDSKTGVVVNTMNDKNSAERTMTTEKPVVEKPKVVTSVPPVAPIIPEVKTEVKLINETVETVVLPKTVEGVVTNCAKLNVRAEPSTDAEVVCILDATSEIEIDVNKSSNEWFKVCTATGIEGYCMRKFVDARL